MPARQVPQSGMACWLRHVIARWHSRVAGNPIIREGLRLILEPYGSEPTADEKPLAVPLELEAAFERNAELRDALMHSEMPIRFQAMVLGLATLKQANFDRRRS